jgi:putative phage-type endonuclease
VIVNVVQNTPEWRAGRANSIGASESAVLMGSLPFKYGTVTNLWKRKVGLEGEKKYNAAMTIGSETEEQARNKYTEVTGYEMLPLCFQHGEYPFISASFDGINLESKISLEIKVPMEYGWAKAKAGKINPYYYTQVQHHFLAAETDVDIDFEHFWIFNSIEGGCLFKIKKNPPYIEEIERRCIKLWNDFVVPKQCPVPTDFGINDKKPVDPYIIGDMSYEFIGFYPNLDNLEIF